VSERNIHFEFARAYMRAVRDYDQASYYGNPDKIENALARKQELERGVSVVVHNREVLL
jgi:hypothetical protein